MSEDGFDDIRLAQLMASRLCHDLVGPLGAVSAGLEMVDTAAKAGEMDVEALALAARSAEQMTSKLTYLRVAFGAGGVRGGDPLGEARNLIEKLLPEGRIELDWALPVPEGTDLDLLGRLILNMALIGVEALARGGQLWIGPLAEGDGVEVRAEGPRVLLKDDLAQALLADENINENKALIDITARTVQGYFCRRLARRLGRGLRLSHTDGRLSLAAGPIALTS